MSASQNNLTMILNQQDASGANIILRTLGAFAYAGIVGNYFKGTLTTTGATAFTLPTANVLQTLVVNTHATAIMTLIATVQGGSTQTVSKIQPGAAFANWSITSGATSGFTAISLTSDTTGATYEAFLGG